LAWLHATPKPDARSRRGREEPATPRLSRIDDLKRKKIVPPMPPNPAPHITDWLIEMGLTEAAGMGTVAISSREMAAWQDNTGVVLEPWVGRLIRRLSSTYLAEGRLAESESCPPPWRAPVTQRELDIEEAQLRSVLG
jgi:hypothetical protein